MEHSKRLSWASGNMGSSEARGGKNIWGQGNSSFWGWLYFKLEWCQFSYSATVGESVVDRIILHLLAVTFSCIL